MGLLLAAGFTACLLLSLACGVLARYSRDVKRDRATTRFLALTGAVAAAGTVGLGVVMLDG